MPHGWTWPHDSACCVAADGRRLRGRRKHVCPIFRRCPIIRGLLNREEDVDDALHRLLSHGPPCFDARSCRTALLGEQGLRCGGNGACRLAHRAFRMGTAGGARGTHRRRRQPRRTDCLRLPQRCPYWLCQGQYRKEGLRDADWRVHDAAEGQGSPFEDLQQRAHALHPAVDLGRRRSPRWRRAGLPVVAWLRPPALRVRPSAFRGKPPRHDRRCR